MKYLDELLNREMTRKEFLQYVGTALLGVVGISGLLKSLQIDNTRTKKRVAASYGSSAYGGSSR